MIRTRSRALLAATGATLALGPAPFAHAEPTTVADSRLDDAADAPTRRPWSTADHSAS